MPNRISVTQLDTFQYYLNADMGLDELYERLYGAYEPTLAMQAGTALHSLLEDDIVASDFSGNGFQFAFACDIDGEVITGEPFERECKHVWCGMDDVELVGKIDVETPNLIIDHKLTANFDPERYFNSWQWRAYLMMRNKKHFRYQVFECDEVKPNETVYIKAYHTVDMYAYSNMVLEVMQIIEALSNQITQWKLSGLPCAREYEKTIISPF